MPSDQAMAAAPFLGRITELQLLDRRLKTQGSPGLIGVSGEAGVGKTRLVEEFGRRAAGDGRLMVWGRCYESAGMPAYAAFVEVIEAVVGAAGGRLQRPLTDRLADARRRLLGTTGTAPGDAAADSGTYEFYDSFTRVWAEVGGALSLVVALDDLHWADEASLSLLAHLVRQGPRSGGPPVIALWRVEQAPPDAPLSRTLEELCREGLAEDMRLSGLSAAETLEYVQALTRRALSMESVQSLYHLTSGNPLFIRELVRHAVESGRLAEMLGPPQEPGWQALQLPDSVSQVIRLRLNGTSRSLQETLALLSVLGREFEARQLQASALLSESQLSRDVPRAVRLGLLGERRTGVDVRLAFSHPLVGAVLYGSLDPLRRAALHRRVATALESTPGAAHPSQIAHHLIEGQNPSDWARAVPYLVQAARLGRAALAQHESRRYWRRAFDLLEAGVRVSDSERRMWLREFADTCSSAGHPDEAMDLYRRLLSELGPDSDPAEVADIYGAMGWTLHIHGRRSEVAEYLERAVSSAEGDPSHRTASLLAAHAVGLLSSGRLIEGRPYLDRALEMVQRHPQLGAEGIVSHLAVVWHTWDLGGDPTMVPRLIEAAERHFREERNTWSGARLQLDAAVSNFFLGDLERHSRCLESALESSRQIGGTAFEADALAFRSYVASIAGDWQAADADAHRCEDYLESAGSSIYGEGLRRGRALRHLWQGRIAEARQELQNVDSFLNASLEAHLCLAEGDEAAAASAVSALAPMLPADGHGGVWLMFALSCASALCTLGRAAEAAKWYDALERNKAWSMDWWQPLIELGRIAAGGRHWRQAFDHFEEAIAVFDARRWRTFSAIARLEYAEARARRGKPGDRPRARALLEEAIAGFDGLGMASCLERAAAMRRRIAPGRGPSSAPAYLSPREAVVLALMVDGLSNRQIAGRLGIGMRTVETHVAHILSKLDVPSRSAAAAAAVRRGLV